jgi:hypothetical protein
MATNKLKTLNLVAGSLHAVLFFALVVIVCTTDRKLTAIKTATVSVQPNFRKIEGTDRVDEISLTTVEETGEFPLAALIIAFVLITAGFHFFLVCKNKSYAANIEKECNPYRWLEYGITASIMVTIIAFTFGLREFNTLLVLFALNALVMFQGYVVELLLSMKQTRSAVFVTVASWAAYLTYWVVLLKTAVQATDRLSKLIDDTATDTTTFPNKVKNRVMEEEGQAEEQLALTGPDREELEDLRFLIISVSASIFLLYTCFAIVQAAHVHAKRKVLKRIPPHCRGVLDHRIGYAKFEVAYVALSFASKLTLAVFMFWGLYGRSRNSPAGPLVTPTVIIK